MFSMIVEPGREFDLARVLAVVWRIVNYQNVASCFIGERTDNSTQHGGQHKQKAPPVCLWIAQQHLCRIFFNSKSFTDGNAPINGSTKIARIMAVGVLHEVFGATTGKKRADGAVIKKIINSRHHSRRILLRNRDWCIVCSILLCWYYWVFLTSQQPASEGFFIFFNIKSKYQLVKLFAQLLSTKSENSVINCPAENYAITCAWGWKKIVHRRNRFLSVWCGIRWIVWFSLFISIKWAI